MLQVERAMQTNNYYSIFRAAFSYIFQDYHNFQLQYDLRFVFAFVNLEIRLIYKKHYLKINFVPLWDNDNRLPFVNL